VVRPPLGTFFGVKLVKGPPFRFDENGAPFIILPDSFPLHVMDLPLDYLTRFVCNGPSIS
jgi:hypothetical protein